MAFVQSEKDPQESWVEKYNLERCFERNWHRKENARCNLEKIDRLNLNTDGYSHYDIRGKYILTFLIWFIQSYSLSEKKSNDWIFERLISQAPPIPALDDYFRKHIKEAS